MGEGVEEGGGRHSWVGNWEAGEVGRKKVLGHSGGLGCERG